MRTVFKRPMEAGDKLLISGTASPAATTIRFNIHNIIAPFGFPIHIKSDFGAQMIYSTFTNKWGPNERGPMPYIRGQPYLITIEYTGFSFNVYSGNTLIKTYALRTPTWYVLGATDLYGTHISSWLEMVCKNPPTTVPPQTTRRNGGGGNGGDGDHGHGHGHGNGHGHGHGHGYDHGSSSFSSSSSEEC